MGDFEFHVCRYVCVPLSLKKFLCSSYNEHVISFVFSKKLNHFKKDFSVQVTNRPQTETSMASTRPALSIILYILKCQDMIFLVF